MLPVGGNEIQRLFDNEDGKYIGLIRWLRRIAVLANIFPAISTLWSFHLIVRRTKRHNEKTNL